MKIKKWKSFNENNVEDWNEIKSSLYVGDSTTDEYIDTVIDMLSKKYDLPTKKQDNVFEESEFDFYKLNGMIIETVDYDNGEVKIKTDNGEFEIYCGGGADIEAEFDATLPQKVISVDFDGYEVTIELENGEELFFLDETGGEGLEIWKTK